MPDTIAAIATAQIPSAIGILRLSGPDTKAILDRVFFPMNGVPMSRHPARTMVLGRVKDGAGRVLDSALCVLKNTFNPASYFGAERKYAIDIYVTKVYYRRESLQRTF